MNNSSGSSGGSPKPVDEVEYKVVLGDSFSEGTATSYQHFRNQKLLFFSELYLTNYNNKYLKQQIRSKKSTKNS